MVRDLFTGADAIRVYSRVLLVFGVGPILAPMVGSGVLVWFGWREIFFLLTASACSAWCSSSSACQNP